MTDKQELKNRINKARKELSKIEDKEARERATKYVGRCFKTRNNYSCPEGPRDYWWLYFRVDTSYSGGIKTTQFQIDKYGEAIIATGKHWSMSLLEDYQEITAKQFENQYEKLMKRLRGIA